MPAGVSRVCRGKSRSFQIAHHGDIIETTLRATEALSLEGKEEKIEDDRVSFRSAKNFRTWARRSVIGYSDDQWPDPWSRHQRECSFFNLLFPILDIPVTNRNVGIECRILDGFVIPDLQ